MSIFHITCRRSASLLLASQDRRLGMRDRVALRFHLGICEACTRFNGQLNLMRDAMGQWRRYREGDAGDGDPGSDRH